LGILYVVATPIGNLEDVTLRALRVLSEVDLIAAEDTRVTRKLLARHGIRTPVTSYHEHNRAKKLPSLLSALEAGDVALVSDAGAPGVSDPGAGLVNAAAEAGRPVVPVPGPSAVTSALSVSGLPADRFVGLGFLPRRRADRVRLLKPLASETRTIVAFETPHRLRSALEDIHATLGDRRITVCREMTKLYEEVFRGTVSDALAHFETPRGEFTLVIEGCSDSQPNDVTEDVRESLAELRSQGLGTREAVARVVEETGVSRRQAYRIWLETAAETERGTKGGDPGH
jgi:16S rRNA (cytidine1402-2'-O)-methyltransferase